MNNMMTIQDVFNLHINEFVVLNAKPGQFPSWQKNRDQYLYTGQDLDECNLREVFQDEVVIEFDEKEETTIATLNKEAWFWIRRIENIFKKNKYHYWITDHKGKSPHFHYIINGLSEYSKLSRRRYKQLMMDDIIKYIKFSSVFLTPDISMTAGNKLVALENSYHWKGKYGYVHIIEFSQEPFMQVNHEQMKAIKSKIIKPLNINNTQYVNGTRHIHSIMFQYAMKKWYKNGNRNNLLMGVSALMRRQGIAKDELLLNFKMCRPIVELEDLSQIKYHIDRQYSQDLNLTGYNYFFSLIHKEPKDVYIDFVSSVWDDYDL